MPHENKSSKIENAKRIRTIQEWMMLGHSTSDIITQAVNQWTVTKRMAYNYIKQAYEEFKKLNDEELESRRGYHIESRLKLYRDLKDKNTKAAGVALNILQDIAKLEGLYVDRQEIDLTTKGEKITGINYIIPKANDNNN